MLNVIILRALRDNYIFLLLNPKTKSAIAVDPAESAPVTDFLNKNNLTLDAILITHFHADHTGGNRDLSERFPGLPIFGGSQEERIPKLNRPVREGEPILIWNHKVEILDLPGHTRGHIAYYFPPGVLNSSCPNGGDLFSGDTIFGGTCGAIFEGTCTDMFRALRKIRSLPLKTRIWCSHEYTEMYLHDALRLEPDNQALRLRWKRVQGSNARGIPTVPLLLEEEMATNPFLRWDSPEVCAHYGTEPGIETFARIVETAG